MLQQMRDDYGEDETIPEGLLAKRGSEPMSLQKFVLIMMVCAGLSIYVLNMRKLDILKEAYSTMSIFKKN